MGEQISHSKPLHGSQIKEVVEQTPMSSNLRGSEPGDSARSTYPKPDVDLSRRVILEFTVDLSVQRAILPQT